MCCLFKAFALLIALSLLLHKLFLLLNSKIEWTKVNVFCLLFSQIIQDLIDVCFLPLEPSI